jgi:hypothetical protein
MAAFFYDRGSELVRHVLLARPIHNGSLFRPFPMQSVLGRTSSTSFFTA